MEKDPTKLGCNRLHMVMGLKCVLERIQRTQRPFPPSSVWTLRLPAMSPLSPAFPKADFLLVILMRFSSMFHVSRATPTQSSTSARTISDFMISPAYRRTNSKKIESVVVKISTTSMVRRKRCSESKCLPWSGRQRDHRHLNRCHIFVRLPLSLFHVLPSTLWVLCRGSSNLLLFPLLGDLSFIFRNRPLLGLSHWARKLTDKRTTGQTPDVRVRGRTPLCIACEYLYYSDTHEAIPLWVFTLTVVSVAASLYHSQKSATPTTTAAAVFYHVLRPISPSMPI